MSSLRPHDPQAAAAADDIAARFLERVQHAPRRHDWPLRRAYDVAVDIDREDDRGDEFSRNRQSAVAEFWADWAEAVTLDVIDQAQRLVLDHGLPLPVDTAQLLRLAGALHVASREASRAEHHQREAAALHDHARTLAAAATPVFASQAHDATAHVPMAPKPTKT